MIEFGYKTPMTSDSKFYSSTMISVAIAKANVFQNNGINVGRKFAKILKILNKIDDVKSRGVI